MAATATLYQHTLQNNLQDHNALADQNQYLTTFFCRALYDYQSRDASSLSFHRGDIIEVLTQLDSGWWDGLLHDERGWFPSNYVAPVSEQEVEQELRAARVDQQDSDWIQDERPEPAGPPSDFWMPQVAPDGRIFYVNTQTGERSNELPTEADSDTEPLSVNGSANVNANANAYASPTAAVAAPSAPFARSNGATAPAQSPTAGFGLPRRSGTPEPWVKRLADDGMSYYYLNTIDRSIRWTAPSPQLEAPRSAIHDSFPLTDGRQRADSAVTRDRLSVYSDDSDINPLGILGRAAAHTHSGSVVTATTPTPGHQDDTPDVQAARELQATLQDQFAPPVDSLDDLAQAARAAITDLLDAALVRSDNPQIKDAVKRATDAIRNLVYASATLLGPLTSLPSPYTADAAASDVTELKPFHRKVTATMVKLVSSIRASVWETPSDDETPARFETDAGELERAIAAFVNEVLRRRAPHQAARRVRAVLRSADGAKGVGLELIGAGAAAGWKGFGFIEPLVGERLDPEILVTVKQHQSRLDDALVELEGLVAGEQALEVIVHGQKAIRYLVSFLGVVADINIARALDFDSLATAVADPSYLQSVARARELMRTLEATVQAVFEDGAVLLNTSQSASIARVVAHGENRPWDILVSAIPTLRSNVEDVSDTIELLIELAQSQADACAKAGLDASIGIRDAARLNGDTSLTEPGARETLRPDTTMDFDMGFPHDGHDGSDGDDMVEFGDVFGARPMRGDRDRDRDVHPAGMFGHGRSDTSIDRLYDSTGGTRDRGESLSGSMVSTDRDTLSTGAGWGPPTSETTLVDQEKAPPEVDDFIDEEDFLVGASAKTPERGHKIKALLGHEAPDAYITMANADAKPWFLRAEYGAKDIYVNPEGGIRGGTLPALIERLTMHDNRDTGFNSTFLVTFKSFTTLDELFDGLVKRFYIQPPPNLTQDELKKWTEQKQVFVRFRVINILKSMVTDEDVLEKEDMHILDRIKEFASTVEKEVVPPIPAAKQLLSLVDRAQSSGDAMIKMTAHTPNFPPPPIVPKTSKAMKLLDIEPLELARQLTIMESKLFAKIRPMECLNRGRDVKTGDSSDDNISAIIDTSNKVAEWVADAVLSKDDSKKRAAIVKQFIAVADRCRLLQNFSTMAALVAGLNSPPIRRLKRTWEQVNARSKAQLQEAEQTMDTNKNFTRYRAILKSAQLPCVPFFGVYLSVLTFIQDGNKNMIQGDIINFSKRDKFAEVIREIKHYQSKPYNLTPIPSVQNYIDESLSVLGPTVDVSDRAWNLSLEREPREREDEKMARLLQESGFL